METRNSGQPYAYQPASKLSTPQLAHRRYWDRARQRAHRYLLLLGIAQEYPANVTTASIKAKNRLSELEAELQHVRAQLEAAEKERDELRQIITSAFSAMKRCQSSPNSVQSQRPGLEPDPRPEPALETCGVVTETENIPLQDAGSCLPPLPFASSLSVSDPFASISEAFDEWSFSPSSLHQCGSESLELVLQPQILCLDPGVGMQNFISNTRANSITLPLNSSPMSALDHAILDIERLYVDLVREIKVLPELAKPAFPDVSSLLNPIERSADTRKPIATSVVARVMSQMPVRDATVRLAAMWLVCNLLRWRLCRSSESFAALPEFLRPTELQLKVPHPIWVDTIIWPQARDRIIQYFDYSEFDVFRRSLGNAVSSGWQKSIQESLEVTGTSGEYVLSADFQSHLGKLANWTVHPSLVESYPFLDGAVNVRSIA